MLWKASDTHLPVHPVMDSKSYQNGFIQLKEYKRGRSSIVLVPRLLSHLESYRLGSCAIDYIAEQVALTDYSLWVHQGAIITQTFDANVFYITGCR